MGAFRTDPNIAEINDKITKADTDRTIAFTEYQIKALENKAFVSTHYKNLGSGEVTNLYIKNPEGSGETVTTMLISIHTTDQALVHYYGDVEGVSGGTPKKIAARNRGYTGGSVLENHILADISYSDATELLDPEVIPGGKGKYANGSAEDGYISFVLPEGTDVMVVVENKGNSNDISIRVDWWEE